MRTLCIFAVLVTTLCACQSSAVISDISDSAVHVQARFTDNSSGDVTAVANQGCGNYGKTATPISFRCLDQYCMAKDYLFACRK